MPANPYSAPKASQAKAELGAGWRLMTVLARILGGILSGAALLGSFVSTLALIDPRGTQQASDADPFGPLPSTGELWLQLATWLVLLCVGLGRRSR